MIVHDRDSGDPLWLWHGKVIQNLVHPSPTDQVAPGGHEGSSMDPSPESA